MMQQHDLANDIVTDHREVEGVGIGPKLVGAAREHDDHG
jgi:hypothetical protein